MCEKDDSMTGRITKSARTKIIANKKLLDDWALSYLDGLEMHPSE